MKKKSILMVSALLILTSIALVACNKEAQSKINFIFKPSTGTGLAAVVNGEKVTDKQLVSGIEAEIHRKEMEIYNLKMNKLRALILEKLMEADPKKKGLTNDEYLKKYIAKKVDPSAKEIKAFIKERKIPKEQITDQIKERIKQYLGMDKKKKAVDIWMAKKTKNAPIEVYFTKPERPVFNVKIGNAPVKGKKDAKITIIEFTDFQCPYCKKAHETIKKVQKKYGKDVRVAIKHNPLPFHHTATDIAKASFCAQEQGEKYIWKFNDTAFDKVDVLKDKTKINDELLKLAQSVGLNKTRFSECVKSNKFKSRLDSDMKEAKDLKLNSVPMFFINGKLLQGAVPMEQFVEVIDEELNKN